VNASATAERRTARPLDGRGIALCAAGEIMGGVERFIFTLSARLQHAGVRVLVVLFHDGPLADAIREAGIPLELIRCQKYDLRQVARLAQIIRQHRIDLLHVHGYKATIAGGLAAPRCRIPIVKTEHGRLEARTGWRHWHRQVRMKANLWADALATRYLVRTVVFVSHHMKESASRQRATRDVVIQNGVEVDSPIVGTCQARDRGDFDRRYFHVGIVGRLTEVKGHRYLLDAVTLLKDIEMLRVHVFGRGPLEAAYRAQCGEAGISDRVVFHGFREDVRACMRRLDLLAMPSLQEGLPYALLEAMQSRLPIVASDVPGIREVLPRGAVDGGVLVPPADAGALASAIRRLHADAELRRRMASAGYRRLCHAFRADDMAGRYVDLYADILSRSS